MKEIPKQDVHEVSGGGLGGGEIDYAPLPSIDYPQCPSPATVPESSDLS